MKRILLLLSFTVLVLSSCSKGQDQPLKVIFETDMGNDIDDALALDMLYKYMDAGLVDLLAVGVNKTGYGPVEFVDIMNTWYGYPYIPIGKITDGPGYSHPESNYAAKVASMKNEAGWPLFKAGPFVGKYSELPETPELYRRVLARQPDHSVTIISVGFSTNIARLLESGPDKWSDLTGKELIAKKVKLLSVMAANLNPNAYPSFNIVHDIPAAKRILEEWPTEIAVSPAQVGTSIRYPASSIENDFGWTDRHPLVEAYKAWGKMPYDRPTWDLTSVLYAVEGGGWFTVSPKGKIIVDDRGYTAFEPCEEGNLLYLSVTKEQADSILTRFLEIIPTPPVKHAPVEWHEGEEFPVYGKVSDQTEGRYDRLPAYMKGVCREPVWYLGRSSAGVYVRFRAKTPVMHVKWTSLFNNTMNHMTDTGTKGVDLYALTDDLGWRYVGSGRPVGKENQVSLVCSDEECEYMLYLSLYDGVEALKIGVVEGGYVGQPQIETPGTERPVIMYGTSILQGGCANRPGMAHTNILSRLLDREVINLGFSGNAQLDYEIAELMASHPNPGAFVLDNAPNCTASLIDQKGETFFRILRDRHPDVPIIFVESPYLTTPFNEYELSVRQAKNVAHRALYDRLKASGEQKLYYVTSDDIMGHDGEATVDGVHFTDLGMTRYAQHLLPTLKKVVK